MSAFYMFYNACNFIKTKKKLNKKMLKIIKLKHLVLVKRKQNKNTYFKNKKQIFSALL